MKEDFLHYVWKYQKYNSVQLRTHEHQKLTVYHTGIHNQDSGPDFEEARMKIGPLEWVGSVEIHIRSSDWINHQHSKDKSYETVILHVVWEHDREIFIDQRPIPTLELKKLVDPSLTADYLAHINSKGPILCATQHSSSLDMAYLSMLDKAMVQRMEAKAEQVFKILRETKNDWDETSYRILAANFGFATNKHTFSTLSRRTPFAILRKNLTRKKIESLLFGQAGFLDQQGDPYLHELSKEYDFLSKKYPLPPKLNRHEWKFGRVRPANFPTLRIAQFANLLFTHPDFFDQLIELEKTSEYIQLLNFDLSPYWNEHYDFGKKKKQIKNPIGIQTQNQIVINTLVPLLIAYSKFSSEQKFLEYAIGLLEMTPPEQNKVTRHWSAINRKPKNALDSQGQIELFSTYCTNRQCLSCSIGLSLLDK